MVFAKPSGCGRLPLRQMQLAAFLESVARYAPYHSTDVCQSVGVNFEREVRAFLGEHERVVFHTDDDVFYRRAWGPPDHWQAVHSIRLGVNTSYQQTTGHLQQLPAEPLDTQLLWKWRDAGGDFGYPLSLNATVYRSADLLPLMDFSFSNPTQLEAQLAARADRFTPEWMTAPLHSCCVSIPLNRVTTDSRNPISDNPDWSAPALAKLYEEGWRMDLDAMDFTNVIGAHQVIEPRFHRV